jgi:cysteine synthase A
MSSSSTSFTLGLGTGVAIAAGIYYLAKRFLKPSHLSSPKLTVDQLVGKTPIVKISPSKLGVDDCQAEVYVKLEFQNPGGSVKDRIAVAMIDKAEEQGLIKPGITTLVEATSGNTGIALAMVGAARGYKVVVAMPRLQSMLERYILIRSFGGVVLLSEPDLKSQGFLDLAEKYSKDNKNCYLMRQFTNEANPKAHYDTTGPEIWKQMNGKVDAVVMGAGTGGTAVGVGKYLKEMDSICRIVVVEPTESRVMQGAIHRKKVMENVLIFYIFYSFKL